MKTYDISYCNREGEIREFPINCSTAFSMVETIFSIIESMCIPSVKINGITIQEYFAANPELFYPELNKMFRSFLRRELAIISNEEYQQLMNI